MGSNDTSPPGVFTPNENVQSPELQQFFDKLPLDLLVEAVPGTYYSYPPVLLPEGDYSQYLTGNERVINLGKNVLIVFGNPQGIPQTQQPQLTPTSQPQEQQSQVENSNVELNNLEKILNIELYPYIPDWLKFYLVKYGVTKGESSDKQELKEIAEKVWNELQKNWNKILELLEVRNASVLPTTVLALSKKFPSEGKGSEKKVTRMAGEVKEETTRSDLSYIIENLRVNYLIPLVDSIAPHEILHLRIFRPMTQDEIKRFLEELSEMSNLYRDAYLIFSFANMFKNKGSEQVKGTDLKEASPEKLKYLQDLVDAYKRLKSAGLYPPLIVDASNTLLVGSLNELSPNGNYTVLRINDLDLSQANEERLKELKSLLNFAMNAFDDRYGALIVKTTINPSVLGMEVFKTIVKLLGICSEGGGKRRRRKGEGEGGGDEACLYKARQELLAFPENRKDTFIKNVAKDVGRNETYYKTKYINQFATLFALVNYYDHLSELKKDKEMNYGVAKYSQNEEEKAKRILKTVKQGFKISRQNERQA
jgi:hypothetical protein